MHNIMEKPLKMLEGQEGERNERYLVMIQFSKIKIGFSTF